MDFNKNKNYKLIFVLVSSDTYIALKHRHVIPPSTTSGIDDFDAKENVAEHSGQHYFISEQVT